MIKELHCIIVTEILINKLIKLFGIDSQNKGYYDLEKKLI
jgi:hypothetical protein